MNRQYKIVNTLLKMNYRAKVYANNTDGVKFVWWSLKEKEKERK